MEKAQKSFPDGGLTRIDVMKSTPGGFGRFIMNFGK